MCWSADRVVLIYVTLTSIFLSWQGPFLFESGQFPSSLVGGMTHGTLQARHTASPLYAWWHVCKCVKTVQKTVPLWYLSGNIQWPDFKKRYSLPAPYKWFKPEHVFDNRYRHQLSAALKIISCLRALCPNSYDLAERSWCPENGHGARKMAWWQSHIFLKKLLRHDTRHHNAS